MTILILPIQYPPDVNSTGMLMQRLGRALIARGHIVHVVTGFPHYADFRIAPEYRGRLVERTREPDGIYVTRVWLLASGAKQRMWHRLASYLTYNLGAFFAAHASTTEYDIALAPSGSFFTGITAWAASLLRGFPFIYNVQDVYPDVPARAGQLEAQWQVRWLDRIARFMFARARHITVISEEQRRNLLAKGVPADKVSVVPNFVDTDVMVPLPRDPEVAARFGWQNQFVIMHSGNIGFAYDFDSLIEAANRLRRHPDIRFVLIGEGVRKAELMEKAQTAGLGNVQFLPFQPEADLPRIRSCADVQVSLYRRGSSELSLPSKLYEIMASGRPVLASAEPHSEVTRLVLNAESGMVVEPEDAEDLTAAILELRADPALRARLGESGRAYAVAHHSLDAIADEYHALFTQLVRHD